MWVPVPEHKTACSGKQAKRKQQAVLSSVSLVMAAGLPPGLSNAEPTGGVVTTGGAIISSTGNAGAKITNIKQNTPVVGLEWSSFNIGRNETVNFIQASDASVAFKSSANFKGVFEGLGHSITGLKINRPTDYRSGLFGSVQNALIRNIDLKDINVSGRETVGGLVGFGQNSLIENSHTSGNVHGNTDVGGLVGYFIYGNIIDSSSTANISPLGSNTGYDMGGLVGTFKNGEIKNSFANGEISGTSDVGGLIGWGVNPGNKTPPNTNNTPTPPRVDNKNDNGNQERKTDKLAVIPTINELQADQPAKINSLPSADAQAVNAATRLSSLEDDYWFLDCFFSSSQELKKIRCEPVSQKKSPSIEIKKYPGKKLSALNSPLLP